MRFYLENMRWLSATALLLFTSSFGQTFFIALFAGHIMGAFNLSASQWGAIYGGATMASGIVILWAGGLADIFRVRVLAIVFIAAMALSCLAMALNMWLILLPVVIFLLRFNGQGMLSHIGVVGASRWFVKNRGRALAFTTLGFSFGEAILPVTFALLLGFMAWQNTWLLAAAGAMIFMAILLVLLRAERTPKAISLGRKDEATGIDGRHWTRSEALRHGLFWGIVPVICAAPFLSTALFFQQVHFADKAGWNHTAFVALFPFYTFASVGFSLFWGAMVDRFGAKSLLAVFLIPLALAFFIFSQFNSFTAFAIGFILIGAMQGGNATIPTAFFSESYGTKHIGALRSLATTVTVLSSAVSPPLTGYLIDQGVPFSQQMPFYGGAVLLICLSCYFVCRRFFAPANLAP